MVAHLAAVASTRVRFSASCQLPVPIVHKVKVSRRRADPPNPGNKKEFKKKYLSISGCNWNNCGEQRGSPHQVHLGQRHHRPVQRTTQQPGGSGQYNGLLYNQVYQVSIADYSSTWLIRSVQRTTQQPRGSGQYSGLLNNLVDQVSTADYSTTWWIRSDSRNFYR